MTEGHPDLQAEQAYLDGAYRYLDDMRRKTEETVAVSARIVESDNTVDAKVAKYHLDRRLEALSDSSAPLCFGRIDTEEREQWYVGRRHVEDTEGHAVVVDWRAPVSAAFYRATAIDPYGLTFRRRFGMDGSTITVIFDEDLTDAEAGAAVGVPDPLLAELEQSRSGQMSDIVATIAAEQDEIIRAPLDELLIVQGGPGTGKTAVGLHRAAFLLFQNRMELMDKRVLVVGPNPVFLRYISEVLPSLGETSVRQTTIEGLMAAKYRVRSVDSDTARQVKGDSRMSTVVERAIRHRIRIPDDGVTIKAGLAVIRLDASDLEQMVKSVLSGGLPFNAGRDVFRRMVVAEGWRRHSARPEVDPGQEPVFTGAANSDPDLRKALNSLWPSLTAPLLITGLYRSARRLGAVADGLLSAEEQETLLRKGPSKLAEEPWTLSDLPILDEADMALDGSSVSYGHVVVDEAQDLSAMALRMIGRRADRASMTVLGDLAQATAVEAVGSWETTINHLTSAHDRDRIGTGRLAELTVGYRVPAAILDVANRLLPEAAPSVTPARSVRPGGEPPRTFDYADRNELLAVLAAETRSLRERGFSVAVIAGDERLVDLADALNDAAVDAQVVRQGALPGREAVAVLDPAQAKGLEFDAVIIVEPSDIFAMPSGGRHLYVAMTRSVQYLALVASRSLPPVLGV